MLDDDGNYTQFDVSVDNVNVTLSFARWLNGKGLLRDVEMKGIRGVVDRTHDTAADRRRSLKEGEWEAGASS